MREEETEKKCFDLIVRIPREGVVNLGTTLPILRSEELCIKMCNLAHLRLIDMDVSTFFVGPGVRGSHTLKDLLSSLDSISIIRPGSNGSDWNPFIDFLTRRAAVGNRISSAKIDSFPRMDTDVVGRLSPVVEDLGDVDGDEDGYCGYQWEAYLDDGQFVVVATSKDVSLGCNLRVFHTAPFSRLDASLHYIHQTVSIHHHGELT